GVASRVVASGSLLILETSTPVIKRPQAGSRPRERRSTPSRTRQGRRSGRSSASRDGPSGESEGDGEPPPSPAAPDLAPHSRKRAPSNSQRADEVCRRWSVGSHGIDTLRLVWHDPEAASALRRLATSRAHDEATGRR